MTALPNGKDTQYQCQSPGMISRITDSRKSSEPFRQGNRIRSFAGRAPPLVAVRHAPLEERNMFLRYSSSCYYIIKLLTT